MKLKLISNGTNSGTKLINETSGEMVNLIQKLSFKASAKEDFSNINLNIINIPIEIVADAKIKLVEFNKETVAFEEKEIITKEVKVLTENGGKFKNDIIIYDNKTNEVLGGIQEVIFEATPSSINFNIVQLNMENK